MTIATGETERSALESKDRQQLATIARALGGSPPARARKDELVDLILALTDEGAGAPKRDGDHMSEQLTEDAAGAAGDEPGADSGDDGGSVDTADRNGRAEDTETTSDRSDDDGKAERSKKSDDDDKADKAEKSDDKSEKSEKSEDKSDRGDRAERGGGRNGEQSRDRNNNRDGNRNQQRNRDGNRNQGDGNRNQSDGNRNQGGGNQGGNQGDDAEPGNRKRRRRGRNQGGGREENEAPVQDWDGEPVEVAGLLDLRDEGYGFLRLKGAMPSRDDVYVSVKQVRQFGMRKGDRVTGASRPANRNEKNPALLRVDTVNDMDPEKAKARPRFEDLTPLFPDERLRLEEDGDPGNMTARIIDLISPVGKGQRGLIVSPPKAGKTTVMKQIAKSIEANNPEVKLMVLLVDERPEEVTDMRRTVKGEVIASTFDRPADEHTSVAELAIDRAKRMVEMGEDVVIILDGITRLSRAYNLAAPATGRIMSGGIDTGALYPPKRFFGAARNLEEGGSLTILATALVETGSKMDEVIFEEFKGTGNMELRLDRKLAERRIYPAIDVDASSTRHEELLFERKQLQQVWKLRRVLSGLADGGGGGTQAGLELLIDRLKTFKNNDEFLAEVAKGPSIAG
jgi:transcription termination factor Rho